MGTLHRSDCCGSSAAEAKLKIRSKVRVNYASDERSCKALNTVCRLSGALSEGSKGYQGQESGLFHPDPDNVPPEFTTADILKYG